MKLSRMSELRESELESKPCVASKNGLPEKQNRFPATRMLLVFLVFAALFSFPQRADATMITSNIIHRTFHIRWNNSTGTGFTIDRGSKQYLVTARHVVHGIESGHVIKIFHDKEWKDLVVNVVGIGKGDVDVAVLACSVRLSPSLPLVASAEDIFYGQQVSFLGYPFGWDGGGEQINRGVPLPFVKAGIVSAIESDDVTKIFLDAHVNKGFSGGPVVFVPYGQSRTDLRVAGVVASYPTPLLPIVDRNGNPLTNPAGDPIGYVQENPGIVVAIAIKHALELIDANPIGFQLSADKNSQ